MRLTEEERGAVRSAASSLVDPASIVALAGYGSKVAGYARPDSDYDVLVVAKKFREGVRYRYVKEPVEASALVVADELLLQDARTAYLGEFVVGRLLNVYEPIENAELLREAELEYKKRVIVEGLFELSSDYGDFARHVSVPYDYFLFEKLRKRSLVYPPALYSYIQTYTCARGAENRAASVDGFRSAAESLSERGFFETEEGGVRLVPEKMRGDSFTKVLSLFSLTARSVTQYAVHGYAGRVGFGVFRREALSKLKRIRERPEPPPELVKPRTLLKLDEGVLVADAADLNGRLARVAGIEGYKATERYLGEAYATTRVVTLKGEGNERSFVVKNFSDVRSLKWALLGFWAAAAGRFNMTPLARLSREYRASLLLRRSGVLTPTIVAVAPEERVMVKELVVGQTLARVIDGLMQGNGEGLGAIAEYASVLAKVHAAGMVLGDAKASNVVVSDSGLFLTDLEQALQGGDKAWDLAEFLYYTAKLSLKEERMKEIAEAFLRSYASHGERSTIGKARSLRYLAPFRPFLSPGMVKMLRDAMAENSQALV